MLPYANMYNSLFPFKFIFIDGDDLIASMQLDASDGSVGVFDSANVAFLCALDHVDNQTNETIPWATSHISRTNHASGGSNHCGVHFRCIHVHSFHEISFGRKGDEGASTSNKNTAVLNDITIVQECEERLVDMQNCTFPTLNFAGTLVFIYSEPSSFAWFLLTSPSTSFMLSFTRNSCPSESVAMALFESRRMEI
jgi:hypothetical protein